MGYQAYFYSLPPVNVNEITPLARVKTPFLFEFLRDLESQNLHPRQFPKITPLLNFMRAHLWLQ